MIRLRDFYITDLASSLLPLLRNPGSSFRSIGVSSSRICSVEAERTRLYQGYLDYGLTSSGLLANMLQRLIAVDLHFDSPVIYNTGKIIETHVKSDLAS